MFDIDYDKLISLLLPVRLRQTPTAIWPQSLAKPVKMLYASFLAYRATVEYDLGHNSQVCRMEGMLNDAFDPAPGDRRIYIEDEVYEDDLYVWERAEGDTTYVYERAEMPDVTYCYTLQEVYSGGVDFVVWVPVIVVYDAARMNRLIRKYKLPGRDYAIRTF